MTQLEVICETVTEAQAAAVGGAHSIEVVTRLDVGGLTPALDVVRAIRDAVTQRVNVIVRPHADSFVYSDADRDHILGTVQTLAKTGITTVVFGALQADDTLDLALMQQVSQAAAPIGLTMHRALDHAHDPMATLAEVLPCANRILCSGHPQSAWEGRDVLRGYVQQFGQRAWFTAAGFITQGNIRLLAQFTRVDEMHVGSAARTDGVVDVAKVRALAEALADRDG